MGHRLDVRLCWWMMSSPTRPPLLVRYLRFDLLNRRTLNNKGYKHLRSIHVSTILRPKIADVLSLLFLRCNYDE